MSEDVIQRLFDKIDDLKDELSSVKIEVGKIQTKLENCEKTGKSTKEIVAWVITTAIALYGAFRH